MARITIFLATVVLLIILAISVAFNSRFSEKTVGDSTYQATFNFRGPACNVSFFSLETQNSPNIDSSWQSISLNERLRIAKEENDPIASDLQIAAGLGVSCIGDGERRDFLRQIFDNGSTQIQVGNGGLTISILFNNLKNLVIINGAN